MFCYRCGQKLGAGRTCPACHARVDIYKGIMARADYYYNKGLEAAKARNLSGAVVFFAFLHTLQQGA